MARFKDVDWSLTQGSNGGATTWEQVQVALLMDIRDELKVNTAELRKLNDLMHCRNTVAIPGLLRKIEKRLAKAIPLK